MNGIQRLLAIVEGSKVEVFVSRGDRRRVLAYMDRVNYQKRNPDPELLYNVASEEDVALALQCLISRGLEVSEAEAGLRGADWGDLVSADVAEAQSREYDERRERGERRCMICDEWKPARDMGDEWVCPACAAGVEGER